MCLSQEHARDSQLVKFMMYDVYRQLMIVGVMRHDEFDDRLKYDRGSLGEMLVTLLRIFFPRKRYITATA